LFGFYFVLSERNAMKQIFSVVAIVGFALIGFAQNGQDIQRWSYHVWGTVLDEESRPIPF